jgi:hypothetical protein
MGKGLNRLFSKEERRYTDGQGIYEKMPQILIMREMQIKTTPQNSYYEKTTLGKIGRKGTLHSVDWNVNYDSHYRKQSEVSSEY